MSPNIPHFSYKCDKSAVDLILSHPSLGNKIYTFVVTRALSFISMKLY